jgi:pyrroloquinoline quinone biosynthesis protein B
VNPGPRYLYTHLNNTNPYARPDHDDSALVEGVRIAHEGQVIVV